MKWKIFFVLLCLAFWQTGNNRLAAQESVNMNYDVYRPQVHFSPREHWINDPNGMVYYAGVYHLFFQYYPGSSVWGPMHWGHAVSKDLMHWQELPVALYPDSLGYIFSGSVVTDTYNSSGFGKGNTAPLVAIYTSHDPTKDDAHSGEREHQSIAYSTDSGKSWIKYHHNPVVKNPGISDFRDPKVMWYAPEKKWVMTLAAKDRVSFYSSPNLKDWKKESDFGKDAGAHGGGWECPDLFAMDDNGKQVWVLIVNLNPGGPNKGSATQYFTGLFDGHSFKPNSTATKWLDYGPDEYAGITWYGTGKRKIFLGWMSNWIYARNTPTEKWRGAMTLPRDLALVHIGKDYRLASVPVAELNRLTLNTSTHKNMHVNKPIFITGKDSAGNFPCRLNLVISTLDDFSFILSNDLGEEMIIGYDKRNNKYYMDRTKSGKTDFHPEFAGRFTAPRLATGKQATIDLVIDAGSAELFADGGLSVLTSLFFPNKPYNKIRIQAAGGLLVKKLTYSTLSGIWP